MNFDAQIDRDNKAETRIILIALICLLTLVISAVGIALADIGRSPQDSVVAAPAPTTVAD